MAASDNPDDPTSSSEESEPELTASEYKEIREYKIFQEGILYQRVNIFIVTSSIFVTAFVASAYLSTDRWIPGAIGFIGLVSTIIWWISLKRQNVIVNDQRVMLTEDPIYRLFKKGRKGEDPKWKGRDRGYFPGHFLLLEMLPLTFCLFWLVAVLWLILGKPAG